MTWFALVDDSEITLNASGLDQRAARPVTWLDEGTLLIDLHEDNRKFKRTILKCGELRIDRSGLGELEIRVGSHARHALTLGPVAQGPHLMAYSWSHADQRARLVLSRPGATQADVHLTLPPVARHFDHIHRALTAPDLHLDESVAFFAISDRIEPIFPLPGLLPTTRVLTAWGERDVSQLQRGDMVRVAQGQDLPVLHRLDITLPARGSLAPVAAGVSCFGLNTHQSAAPHQGVAVSGSYVEYMLAREEIEVPFRQLASYRVSQIKSYAHLVTYHGLVLPRVAPLVSGRAQFMSMNIGRLRRKPVQFETSVLAHLPRNALPEHATPVQARFSLSEARAFVHGQVA